jgi:indole-3-glycerol phosphate synthase
VETRRERETEGALAGRARRREAGGARFAAALERPGVNVIAECKKRSPSKGVLRADYDAAAIAAAYARAGAAAISILTEPAFFDGSLDDLEAARGLVSAPLLRKDFIVDRRQVLEARAAGADAVLLIVAALEDDALRELHACALDEGLAALVEVHDRVELHRALAIGARIIGVNSRNLRTLDVDRDLHHRLVADIPDGCVAVAESGLGRASDVAELRSAGYDAFLIGEQFMTTADPGRALRDLLAVLSAASGARHA